MKYTEIMVRYGELSTKGKNRKTFIMQLAQNVKRALADFPALKIHADRDRMHILLNGEDSEEVIPKLSKVFGIQNFSPSIRIEKKCRRFVQWFKRLFGKFIRQVRRLKLLLNARTIHLNLIQMA